MMITEEFMNVRQRELLDEAKQNRLINKIKASGGRRSPNYSRVMRWIGNLMLNWGSWLTIKFGENNIIENSGMVDNRITG